jgi:hypothetical protein
MSHSLRRSISEPIRTGLSWAEAWLGLDRGLIHCWERGRLLREPGSQVVDDPELANRLKVAAELGELPPLWWKGGVDPNDESPPQKKDGSLQYLALWQGLRNEDLDIDVEGQTVVVCSLKKTAVTFQQLLRDEEDQRESVAFELRTHRETVG